MFRRDGSAFDCQNPCHVRKIGRIGARVLVSQAEAELPLTAKWEIAGLPTFTKKVSVNMSRGDSRLFKQ